jgi:gliding motility-associated-like protein
MFKQKIAFFIFAFVCFTHSLVSQITATPSTGCVPQNISFTGPAGTGIYWNFGDGGTSVLQNPGHIYTTPGNYVVTYTSSAGTFTTPILISPTPTANFTYSLPASRCAAMTVTFANTSVGPAPFTSYQWNFGNGAPSAVANPTYTYPGAGSFMVNLTITDANGCSGTVVAGPILVSAPPNVIISTNPSPASGCTAPFIAAFSGSNSTTGSPIGGGLTYNWSFPGGAPASSGVMTPGNVNYGATGSYIASLTVTDNNNCSGSAIVPVNVSMPVVSVFMPTFVCIYDTLKATDNSTAAFTIWQFGDGNSGSPSPFPAAPPNINVKHYFYATPGIKTLTITAYGGGTCTATQTKTLLVVEVTASITATPPSTSCASPFIANYLNASSPNAVNFFWSTMNCNNTTFTSTAANPTFTYTQGSLNPYTIYPLCTPQVLLYVSSVQGCTAQASIVADTLQRPTAWFNKDKKEGCAPLVVTFRDSSQAFPTATAAIASYTWNNGANPPTIVTGVAPPIPNQTFTYATAGTYTPYLIIQTIQGCIDTSFIDTITVVNPAPLSFSFSPSVVCPLTPVQFSASTTSPPVQHWHVTSDNGYFSGCVSDPNPSWIFTHTGTHNFTLSAWKNSCESSTTSPQTVQVNGPIVQSRFTTNCSSRKTVIFNSQLQDAENAILNFGDGSPTEDIPGTPGATANHTVAHTYSNTGDYTVSLTGYNNGTGCPPYTYTMLVQVRDVKAKIVSSPTVCADFSTVFSAATSTDVSASCSTGYTWFFDNAPPMVFNTPTVSYSWPTAGIHTIVLQVKDLNSCMDSTMKTIRVSSPAAQFSVAPSKTICLSTGTLQFTNTTPQTPDPISNYSWDFGDGSPLSAIISPTHTYASAVVPFSIYTVVLTATNSLGCVKSQTQEIQVNKPNAQLNASPNTFICVNQPVNISAPPGYASYSLTFGDGSPPSVTSNSSTAHTYSAAGGYTASVTITDGGGCKSSSSLAFSVQSYPVASFTVISPGAQMANIACLGNNITYSSTSTSTPTYPLTYQWNIGNGANILPIPAVVATYTTTGVFPVTLTVTTPNGCKHVYTHTVGVYSAKADLNLDKTEICLGQTITFNIKNDSNTVHAWEWDFGEGTTTGTILANPKPPPSVSLTYTNYPLPSGAATVVLAYYSSQFACKFFAVKPIQIIKIDASFIRNNEITVVDTAHCLGITDIFSNTSPNPAISAFNWNFGDGSSSALQNPSHIYNTAGIYSVVLTVTQTVNNCIGSSSKNMTIYPLPFAKIQVRDTCKNAIFPLVGSASPNAISYTWSPPAGIANPSVLITTATATGSTEYSLSVTDVNGCVGSTVQTLFIQQPPQNFQWDTTVIIGQTVPVNAYAGTNFSYTWTPLTDLSCQYCPYPISSSTNNITYSVVVADNMGCFRITNTFSIDIIPKSTVDVPTAFTPNGDGTNDIIYVSGWGIRKLNYFRIYNRWGQLLFESNDIKVGWNGFFDGVPQNMETYVYQVSAEVYTERDAVLKTGSFKLIR